MSISAISWFIRYFIIVQSVKYYIFHNKHAKSCCGFKEILEKIEENELNKMYSISGRVLVLSGHPLKEVYNM